MSRKQPAMMASDPDMEDPAVGIPGKLVITFPIGVEGEEVAVLVESEVILVPEPVGYHLALLSVRRDAQDCSLRGIFYGRVSGGDVVPSDPCVIPTCHVEPAVRPPPDTMGSVFPSSSGKLVKEFWVTSGKHALLGRAVKKNTLRLDAEEVFPGPEQAVRVLGLVKHHVGTVGHAILIGVEQHLDVAGTRDCDLSLLGDRQCPGVMGEGITGILGNTKSFRDLERNVRQKNGERQESGYGPAEHGDGPPKVGLFETEASLELLSGQSPGLNGWQPGR